MKKNSSSKCQMCGGVGWFWKQERSSEFAYQVDGQTYFTTSISCYQKQCDHRYKITRTKKAK